MKISDIQTHSIQSEFRTLIIVEVQTDEGITGFGEAGLQRRTKAVAGAIEHMKRWLVGMDAMRIEHIWQRMFRGGFYPGDKLIGSAIAGIDIALWDIKGQALGVPVYELLGGRCRDYVDCFFQPDYLLHSNVDTSEIVKLARQGDADAAVELAKLKQADGQKYFRLGAPGVDNVLEPRESARRLATQMQAVRDAVGDSMELMVDLHTRLDPAESIWFCQQVEPLNMFAVEDPIRSEHLEGYRHIREHVHVPIAAGEQWANKWEFHRAIEQEWIDYARVDVCIAGGLTEAKKIAGWAETHMIRMLPHNPMGPICLAASLHLDLACNNAGPQEYLYMADTMPPGVFEYGFELKDHRLTVPTMPGIGIKFNVEAAKDYPGEMTEPPHLMRKDGAVTNN